MKHRLHNNKSLLYPILRNICLISEKSSFVHHARRRFGRYLAIEILVFTSFIFGSVSLVFFYEFHYILRVLLCSLYAYRILTMALSHISILLLNTGKSTPGDRIHSRLRYLGLTFFHFAEIIIFSSLLIMLFEEIGGVPNNYNEAFKSKMEIVYYSFNTVATLSTSNIYPVSPLSFGHHILVSILGIELIVVVLAIILAVKPEEEVVLKEIDLSISDYWDWRAQSCDYLEWSRDNKLREFMAQLLISRKVNSVVDIGCGDGILCLTLSNHGLDVTGIDISNAMIELAKSQSPRTIKYHIGDACGLPLPDNCVDSVVMRQILHNVFPDWSLAIREAARILRQSGTLLIVEAVPPTEECRSFFVDVLAKTHERHFFTENVLKTKLIKEGFQIEKKEYVVIERIRNYS